MTRNSFSFKDIFFFLVTFGWKLIFLYFANVRKFNKRKKKLAPWAQSNRRWVFYSSFVYTRDLDLAASDFATPRNQRWKVKCVNDLKSLINWKCDVIDIINETTHPSFSLKSNNKKCSIFAENSNFKFNSRRWWRKSYFLRYV